MKLLLQEKGIWLRLKNDEIDARVMPEFLRRYDLQNGVSRNGWFYDIKLVSWNKEKIKYTRTRWKRNEGYKNKKFQEFSDEMKQEFNLRNEFLKKNRYVDDLTKELELQYEEYEAWMQSLFYEIKEETYQLIKKMLQFLNLKFEESFQSGFLPDSRISLWRREINLDQETVISRNVGGSSLRPGFIKF